MFHGVFDTQDEVRIEQDSGIIMDPQPQRAARKLRSLSVTDGSRMGFDGDERGLAIANFVAGASCYRSAKHFAFRTVEKREHGQLSRAKNRLFLVATGLVPGWIALSGFWLFEDPSLALRANVRCLVSHLRFWLRSDFRGLGAQCDGGVLRLGSRSPFSKNRASAIVSVLHRPVFVFPILHFKCFPRRMVVG